MVLAFRGVYPLLLFDCETVVTLAVSVELSDVPAVTASETAEMLAGREHRARGAALPRREPEQLEGWQRPHGFARLHQVSPHCQARGGKATQSLRRSVKMRLTRLTGRC